MSHKSFTLPQATSKFLEACAHNNMNQMILYMECDEVHDAVDQYTYHVGLAMTLNSGDATCFEILSDYMLKKEDKDTRLKNDYNSPAMNSIVSVAVQKNSRPQLDKILHTPPVEQQTLDNALFWCLEEFAENEDIPPFITSTNTTKKIQGVCYVIEKVLASKKNYPTTVEQIKTLAQSPAFYPLFDYIAQNASPEGQKAITSMFSLKTAPPFIKATKEKEMLQKSLKRKSVFKGIFGKSETHSNTKPSPTKKM